MIRIELHSKKYINMHALIDDSDFYLVFGYRWNVVKGHVTYYAQSTKVNGKTIFMHRLIMRAGPDEQVDHQNHCGLDNQRYNLRLVDRSQQAQNTKKRSGGASRYKGVNLDRRSGHWQGEITMKNKRTYLGVFLTEIEAARAYDNKAKELFGDFAKLNFPEEHHESNILEQR